MPPCPQMESKLLPPLAPLAVFRPMPSKAAKGAPARSRQGFKSLNGLGAQG